MASTERGVCDYTTRQMPANGTQRLQLDFLLSGSIETVEIKREISLSFRGTSFLYFVSTTHAVRIAAASQRLGSLPRRPSSTQIVSASTITARFVEYTDSVLPLQESQSSHIGNGYNNHRR